MSSLTDLPELIGFFSYSRDDDEDSNGALSALRDRIQRELRGQLGRSMKTFRLWQDKEAIPAGTLWESEIKNSVAQAVFFIPIVTPTVVRSANCRFELESFLAREAELGRSDLIFPILYIRVLELEDSERRRTDPVLSIIAKRQYLDWRDMRHRDIASPAIKEAIERFCTQICGALSRDWLSPQEREKQRSDAALHADAANNAVASGFPTETTGPESPMAVAPPKDRDTGSDLRVKEEISPGAKTPVSRRPLVAAILFVAVASGAIGGWYAANRPREPNVAAASATPATPSAPSVAATSSADPSAAAKLRFDGLYRLAYPSYSTYLRFYDDGTVLEVTSTGTPVEVAKWFTKQASSAANSPVGKGKYTIDDKSIRFSDADLTGTVDYQGTIAADSLSLTWSSHITGRSDNGVYTFVPL